MPKQKKTKLTSILLTVALSLTLMGCGDSDTKETSIATQSTDTAEETGSTQAQEHATIQEPNQEIGGEVRLSEKATTEATTAEATTEAATEATTAAAEGAAVKYGDQIRVSVEKKETLAGNEGEEPQFESAGEATFVVSKDTEEFKQTDYEMPEDEVEANVNKAIGKKVGESFELSFEYGDGGVTYRYTILQIN